MAGWIAEMLFILLYNRQNIAEYEAYWFMGFPIINLWGVHFTSTFFVFSVMAGWIAGILFMPFSLLILLCNEHNKAWLFGSVLLCRVGQYIGIYQIGLKFLYNYSSTSKFSNCCTLLRV